MISLEDVLRLPLDTPLAQLEGKVWWQALEATTQGMNCKRCQQEAFSLISAMHDLVNARLGKPLFNEENFRAVAGEYARTLMGEDARQSLPHCSPSQAAAIERCIQQLKQEDRGVNPWAVCQSSIGCALPHRSQQQEDEGFMDALVEALKKAGKLEQLHKQGHLPRYGFIRHPISGEVYAIELNERRTKIIRAAGPIPHREMSNPSGWIDNNPDAEEDGEWLEKELGDRPINLLLYQEGKL